MRDRGIAIVIMLSSNDVILHAVGTGMPPGRGREKVGVVMKVFSL